MVIIAFKFQPSSRFGAVYVRRRQMSKIVSLILGVLFVSTVGVGQQIYKVTPDTKDNSIELAVANTSSTVLLTDVEVKIIRHGSHLSFSPMVQLLDSIAAMSEGAAFFSFDVGRSAPINKRDTLEFRITNNNGSSWSKSIIVQYGGPATFALDQNFPNPFNPTTTIYYQLPTESRVTLKVFDILGREVITLVNEERPAGYHDVRWDAINVASGVYFYRMEADPLSGATGFQQIRKLMVIK